MIGATYFIRTGRMLYGHVIHWLVNGKLQDYVNNFKYYISKMLQKRDMCLVFDSYNPHSTKRVTRLRRAAQASRVHQLSLSINAIATTKDCTNSDREQATTYVIVIIV